ncbi:unnamed protein product [Durusdinium trenchii]|uniref:25S rRNA (uridine-N(3))-methyltransferase BMT5-like domain-containing protein n=1 Tax=Durusdinium trenchii TaxID=1381693 RepID=A0ABP0HTM2_9DINO
MLLFASEQGTLQYPAFSTTVMSRLWRGKLPSKEQRGQELIHCSERKASLLGELRAEVTYQESSQILLLGEGNFSFCAAVQRCFKDAGGLTATSYESREDIVKRFGAGGRLRGLEQRCQVFYSLPVVETRKRFRAASFDCVVFNFPLVGRSPAPPDHPVMMRQMYEALRWVLFAGALVMLVLQRGSPSKAYEKVYRPLGYRPGVVLKRAPFSVAFASTWVFRRR